MHDRAEATPVRPIAADVLRGRALDALEPVGDLIERRGIDLDPFLDLLVAIARLEVATQLFQEEGEGVEQWRTVGR